MAIMRYREALNSALREEMARDESVMLMGEDIGVFNGAFKVTAGLLAEFGEKRVRDTPISENTIVGMGVGAAMTGLRPVVESQSADVGAAGSGPSDAAQDSGKDEEAPEEAEDTEATRAEA